MTAGLVFAAIFGSLLLVGYSARAGQTAFVFLTRANSAREAFDDHTCRAIVWLWNAIGAPVWGAFRYLLTRVALLSLLLIGVGICAVWLLVVGEAMSGTPVYFVIVLAFWAGSRLR